MWWRKLKMRRVRYFLDHQYDGYGEFFKQEESHKQAMIAAMIEALGTGTVFCFKDAAGKYYEVDKEHYLREMTWRAKSAYDDALYHTPKSIAVQWRELIVKTASIPIKHMRSYL